MLSLIFGVLFFCIDPQVANQGEVVMLPPPAPLREDLKLDGAELKRVEMLDQLLQSIVGQKQETLWPRFNLLSDPIVLIFPNGHIWAHGLKPNHAAWYEKRIQGHLWLFSEADHWKLSEITKDAHMPIDGQSAFVFRFDPKANHLEEMISFIHERFHLYQWNEFAALSQPIDSDAYGYSAHMDSDNLALALLEEVALEEYVREGKLERLKDFLAINNGRLKRLDPKSILWENNKQIVEGTAEYVDLKIFEIANTPAFSMTQRLSKMFKGESHHPIEWMMEKRHYAVGAAIGLSLDRLAAPEWKKKIQNGATSLSQLLSSSIGLDQKDLHVRFQRLLANASLNAFKLKAIGMIADYKKELNRHFEEFEKSPGIPIHIIRGGVQTCSNHMAEVGLYLPTGKKLHSKLSGLSISADGLWKLKFNGVPYEIGDVFKQPEELVVFIDGKRFKLKDFIDRSLAVVFKSIHWKSETCELRSQGHPGKISSCDGKILIEFTSVPRYTKYQK